MILVYFCGANWASTEAERDPVREKTKLQYANVVRGPSIRESAIQAEFFKNRRTEQKSQHRGVPEG